MGGFYGERKLWAKTISKKHFHNLVAVPPGPKRRLNLSRPPATYQAPTYLNLSRVALLIPYSTNPVFRVFDSGSDIENGANRYA